MTHTDFQTVLCVCLLGKLPFGIWCRASKLTYSRYHYQFCPQGGIRVVSLAFSRPILFHLASSHRFLNALQPASIDHV